MNTQPKTVPWTSSRLAQWVCVLAGTLALSWPVSADPNTNLPFYDTFEQYPNGTLLVDGTNGWYGSTNDDVAGAATTNKIMVQDQVAYASAQSVAIPVEHTLSNRFSLAEPATGVWVQADVRLVLTDDDLSDGATPPRSLTVDNTNASVLFYVSTSGYFVVHNGPVSPSYTNSTNWVTLSDATPRAESEWVRLKMLVDYNTKQWSLAVNHVELTNAIGFLNPALSDFNGFDLYHGILANTSYLDNVYIWSAAEPPAPDIDVVPRLVTNSTMHGIAPVDNSIALINYGSQEFYYTNTFTNTEWLTSPKYEDYLYPNNTSTISLNYDASITNWPPGFSNTTVTLVANGNDAASLGVSVTQVVQVTMNIMKLENAPGAIFHAFRVTTKPPDRTVALVNSGGGSFDYTVEITNDWVGPTNVDLLTGTLGAFGTNLLPLVFADAMTNWAEGSVSNTQIKISSADGGGVTNTLDVWAQVVAWGVSNLWYTNNVFLGNMPLTNGQHMIITNRSKIGTALNYTIEIPTNNTWLSCSSNSGYVATNKGNNLMLVYSNTAGWTTPGASNTTVFVKDTDFATTQEVAVTLNLMRMTNAFAVGGETNMFMHTRIPTSINVNVINEGGGMFNYYFAITNAWVTNSPNGILSSGPYATNTITLNFKTTTGFPYTTAPTSTTLRVISTDGGGATNSIPLTFLCMKLATGQAAYTNQVMVGRTPPPMTLSVSNIGAGEFGFSVTNTTNIWLDFSTNAGYVTSSNGNDITLVFSNTAGWEVNTTSNTTVLVGSSAGGGATQAVRVLVHVMDLQLDQNGITSSVFLTTNEVGNKPWPTGVAFKVFNPGRTGTINYTVSSANPEWVTCNSNSGILTDSVRTNNLRLNFTNTIPTDWTPGVSNTTITIASSDGGGATQVLDVVLHVMQMTNYPSRIDCLNVKGRVPDPVTFVVTNNGPGVFNYTVTITNAWVTNSQVGLQTNISPFADTIELKFDRSWAGAVSNWSASTSNTLVKIWSTTGGGVTNWLPLSMTVVDWGLLDNDGQALATISNSVMVGRTPEAQTFILTNSPGAPALTAAISSTESWLTPAPDIVDSLPAASTQTVTLTYDPTTNWSPGVSQTIVEVVSGDGITQSVDVVLNVMQMELSETEITNMVMEGEFLPPAQTFEVRNLGAGTFDFTCTNNGADWGVTPTESGSVGDYGTSTVTLTFSRIARIPGTNTATISVCSTNFGGVTNELAVSLVVLPRPVGSNLNFYAATNGLHLEPFTNWSMAATNIADALAIVADGNNLFLSNNVFVLTNTLVVTNGIVLQGWENDPSATLLDGDGAVMPLRVNSTGALVCGVTLMNGVGDTAGGALFENGGTLSNCWVFGNQAGVVGGVYAAGGARVANCVIATNTGNLVGGLSLENAVARDSTILDNLATNEIAGFGGGVWMDGDGGNLLTNCVVSNNVSVGAGGGVVIAGGEIVGCVVGSNAATLSGGGILAWDTNGTNIMIRQSVIADNAAAVAGGGVYLQDSPAYSRVLRNCLVSSNSPEGVFQNAAPAAGSLDLIENCTIVTNAQSGLVLAADQTNTLVRNTIIYFNPTDINAGLGAATNAFFNSCAFYDSFPDQNNLTDDPLFSAPAAFNFQLMSNSPCLGAGTNQDWMTNAVDLVGNPRLSGPSVDMGAYEFVWNWILGADAMTNEVMLGLTPAAQSVQIINRGGDPLAYVVTNEAWLSGSITSAVVAAHSTNTIDLVYAPTADWQPGTSNTTVSVMVTNMGATQTRQLPVTLYVMDLRASVTSITSSIMQGHMPPAVSVAVSNAGGGSFDYVFTNDAWLSGSSTNGALGEYESVTNPVAYSTNIAAWGPGTSNTTISITSSDGGGATQTVAVTVNVMRLDVAPGGLTNSVLLGGTPAAQELTLHNPGIGTFNFALAADVDWLTAVPASGALASDGLESIQVVFSSTAGWAPGVSNGVLSVTSTNGGGATQDVLVVLNVVELLPPASVAASKGTYTDRVALTWAPAANAVSYQVWRHTTSDPMGAVLLATTADLSYNDTSAGQGRTYYYWLKSVNALGLSVFSASDSGARKLSPPTSVSASKRTYTDKVRVTWPAVAYALGYQVWRNTASNTASATKLGSATATTYDDTTAVKETTYYYWVKATNATSVSAFGTPDTGVRKEDTPTPAAPTGLTASQGTYSNRVALSWSASAYAASYEVWRSTTSSSSSAAKLGDTTATSYSDTTAEAGTVYYYWVKAKNTTGTSGFSASASGYCLDTRLMPLFGDFDADSKADPAVYQGSSGRWFVRLSASDYATATMSGFGGTGYAAFVADYDGDRKVDLGVFELATGNWQVKLSGSGYATASVSGFGDSDSTVVAKDFDGDRLADPSIYNTVNGNWRVMMSGSGYGIASAIGFGGVGSTPVAGFYDADALADPAIYGDSSGNWSVMLSASGYLMASLPGFGGAGSEPLAVDFDGDGQVDPAYYRESNQTWYVKLSGSSYSTAILSGFGGTGYVAGAADFDGDGRADPALFHDASRTWHVKLSAFGYVTVTADAGYTP